ncbi:MAG: hypothetical protein WB808_06255 [Candidatus Dormiibacterota bacterium]
METSQLTASGTIILGLSAVALAGAFVWAAMVPSEGRIARWSSHYGLGLTALNSSLVAPYLRRTRSLQVAGGALGWLLSPLYITLFGRPFPLTDNWALLAVAGYFLGAAVAEITFLRKSQPHSSVRAAALARRALSDYIPRATVWAIRMLPLAGVSLAVIYALVPENPQRTVDPSVAFMIASSLLVVVLAALIEWFLRTIVTRPQPAITNDLLAADDAIRAASIHSLAAAGIAVILLSIGWAAVSLGDVIASNALSELLPWFGVACDLAALVVWIGLGHLATWRVQRGTPAVSG